VGADPWARRPNNSSLCTRTPQRPCLIAAACPARGVPRRRDGPGRLRSARCAPNLRNFGSGGTRHTELSGAVRQRPWQLASSEQRVPPGQSQSTGPVWGPQQRLTHRRTFERSPRARPTPPLGTAPAACQSCVSRVSVVCQLRVSRVSVACQSCVRRVSVVSQSCVSCVTVERRGAGESQSLLLPRYLP
jgi:hypothetical protein